ncbi:MAG: class II histone deacetylase [Thermomicrobiales bacterium]
MLKRSDRRVGLVFDERYLFHDAGQYLIGYRDRYPFAEPVPHVGSPAIVSRSKHLLDLFEISGAMSRIPAVEIDDDILLTYHTAEHITRVREIGKTGGDTGTGAPIGRGGDRIARLSVGGVIAATNAVMQGGVTHAYALVRPPGHHAMSDHGMGFCTFANIALAAKHAQKTFGVERIAILDWDVHHGNGTQDAFYDDPSVLFASIHQEDLFPVGWGHLDDTGESAGVGFSINVPLPAGSGNRTYQEVIESIIVPAFQKYQPDLIMISAGQDAGVMDPLGRMSLTTSAFRSMTQTLRDLADEVCDGRLVIAQEGGYSELYAPYCTAAICEGLCAGMSGVSPVEEPYGARAETMPPSRTIGLDARAAINAAIEVTRRNWKL